MLTLAETVLQKGGVIAATGILIVFAALLLISIFIAALPRLLESIATIFPEVTDRPVAKDSSPSLLPDEAVLAAIGYVLHSEMQKQNEFRHGSESP